jgi:uncharacterized membrane protein
MKLKEMVPSGKQLRSAKKMFGAAKDAGVLDKVMPSRNGNEEEQQEGVGHGRRMPIQQSVDIAAPIESVWKLWNKYEDWPKFMHRLESTSQEDETHVKFKVKIWGKSKEWTAEILEQIPDEKIKWRVTEGMSHTGVVTFHELAPRLTRIEANVDIHPGSMIEKLGRGLRHAKRAVRADLHRFKAYVEVEDDFGQDGWRGEIHDAKVTSKKASGSSRPTRSKGSSRASSGSSRASSRRSSSGRSSGASNGSSSARSASAPSRSRATRASGSNGSGSSRSSGAGKSGGSRSSSRKKSTSSS